MGAYEVRKVARGENITITTILCDLDGTLVDSRLDLAVAFQRAWRTVIGGTPPSATAIAQHIGKPLAEMLCELGGPLSFRLVKAFLTAYRHFIEEGDASKKGYRSVTSSSRCYGSPILPSSSYLEFHHMMAHAYSRCRKSRSLRSPTPFPVRAARARLHN
jgi:phosphoglycolate phosphatase-like HAD superfamily hydrolase